MIDTKKFEALGWKFKRGALEDSISFISPRLKEWRLFFPTDVSGDDDDMIIDFEKEFYYKELGAKLDESFNFVKQDMLKQLDLLIDKNHPIPEELKVEFKIKLV